VRVRTFFDLYSTGHDEAGGTEDDIGDWEPSAEPLAENPEPVPNGN
jgi:hypothetical protein